MFSLKVAAFTEVESSSGSGVGCGTLGMYSGRMEYKCWTRAGEGLNWENRGDGIKPDGDKAKGMVPSGRMISNGSNCEARAL